MAWLATLKLSGLGGSAENAKPDFERALEEGLEEMANDGDASAQLCMGALYTSRGLLHLDPIKAQHWSELAVASGSIQAKYNLGMNLMYRARGYYPNQTATEEEFQRGKCLVREALKGGLTDYLNGQSLFNIFEMADPFST